MNSRTPLLVGLVVAVATISLTLLIIWTSKTKFSDSATHPYYADFTNATGIRWKTRVQMNGIDVGRIDAIDHARDRDGRLVARIRLRLLKEYELYGNASLKKSAESLLGDYRLDLDPGTPDQPKLPPGGIIGQVRSLTDLDEIQSELVRVTKNVGDISENFSKVLSGPEGEGSLRAILSRLENSMEAIEDTTRTLRELTARNDEHLDAIFRNFDTFSGALAQATSPGGDLTTLAHNLASVGQRLDAVAAAVGKLVSEESGASQEAATLRTTIEQLNATMANLAAISSKVDQGQGSLGRLVNDPAIAEKTEQTLDDVNSLLGSISRMETRIELRTEYGVPFGRNNEQVQDSIKNTLGLWLLPKPDKYYIIEAIADPRGRQRREIRTVTDQATGAQISEERNTIAFGSLKLSAQFAKRYYFLALRFGIIENTGGIGCNLYGLADRLEFRFDAFDFDRRDPATSKSIFPRLRTTAMVELIKHVSLQAGIDDPLNRELRTWFLGGVLRFSDEDLRGLLTVAPTP